MSQLNQVISNIINNGIREGFITSTRITTMEMICDKYDLDINVNNTGYHVDSQLNDMFEDLVIKLYGDFETYEEKHDHDVDLEELIENAFYKIHDNQALEQVDDFLYCPDEYLYLLEDNKRELFINQLTEAM